MLHSLSTLMAGGDGAMEIAGDAPSQGRARRQILCCKSDRPVAVTATSQVCPQLLVRRPNERLLSRFARCLPALREGAERESRAILARRLAMVLMWR